MKKQFPFDARVFDHGTGIFLQPEINGNPFEIWQDGTAYVLRLNHPDFHVCHYAGVDKRGTKVYEGDIVECKSTLDQRTVSSRNKIMRDPVTGEFYVHDRAPFPCRVDMNAVASFYTCVGNSYEKTGPQEPIFEKDQ
jgi:hypothetical protein